MGYGTLENSYGPIGHIHNGADDNASGVSGVLELARALERLDPAPSRPILLALWDGEEKGLLGSIYWLDHPTVPIGDVKFYINFDMIGRLRNNRIEMYGSRTAAGLRRLASEHNDRANFLLQFTWEMKADSDHYTFFAHNIPTLMPHTGLHADYHRPSDDAEKIDVEGMRRVCQYTAALVADLAERERLPAFRPQSRSETVTAQQVVEKPLPPQPGRLGLGWAKPDGSPGLIVARVTADSIAAQSGIVAGDRIVKFEHQDVATGDELQRMVLTSPADCTLTVVHAQQPPRELHVKLAGTAVRWGFAWREDAAEPGTLIVVRVVDGSAADRAGLVPRDRIYRIDGHNFTGGVDFREALRTAPGAVTLEVENQGRMRNVKVEP